LTARRTLKAIQRLPSYTLQTNFLKRTTLHTATRTPDAVRQEAERHFGFMEQRFHGFMERTQEDCKHEARLGRLVVERALELSANDVLELGKDWEAEHAPTDDQQRSLGQAIFFLCGPLRLLDMEFVHDEVGKLPIPVVRELLQNRTVDHEGVHLTWSNVMVQYRRLPL
jgi:hypothetical protein